MKKNLFIVRLQLTLFITIVLTSISSSGQWVRKADAFQKRSEFAGVVYQSRLYAFLGFGNSGLKPVNSSEVYDPVTDKWTLLNSIPDNAAMTHQGVVLIDTTVWHIGGRVGQNPGPLTGDIWIYNITTNSWSPGPRLTDPATGNPILWAAGGAVLLGRTLHIFGGFTINGCNNDQDNYHLTLEVDTWLSDKSKPAQWKNDLAPLPKKRNHFSSTVLGGKIYAIGGQFGHDCGGGLDQRFSHVYDPSTNTWAELPLLPIPRSHSEGSIFAMDGKIYLVAGQKANNASTGKVTVFEPEGNNGEGKWEDDSSLTLPKRYEGLLAKVIGNTFIISGGGNGRSSNPRKETYSRTIARNPVRKFGFSSGCAKLSANSGDLVKGKTLLFTIDGGENYTTSSNAQWLTVTKNATGKVMPSAVDIEFTANTKGLAPGNYSATITATDSGSGPAYSDASYCVKLTIIDSSSNKGAQTLEAETAFVNGGIVSSRFPDFTGTGFVNYVNPDNDYIEWSYNNSQAGPAQLLFRYSNGKESDRPLKLEVNGVVISNLSFPTTGAWTNWSTSEATVPINAGINTIRLSAIGYSGANMDNLVVKSETTTSPNVAPSVSITTTAAPATINMIATATDQDGTISKVQFYNGTNLIHTDYQGNHSYSWINVPAGTYTITAKATDNKGAVTISSKVTVSVLAPRVSLRTSNKTSNFLNNSDTPASSSFNVFPNPAGTTVFVPGRGLPQNKDFVISVVSRNGTVLKTVRSNSSNKVVEVNVSSLSAGVYTIKATAGFVTMTRQFVKR